MSDQGIKIGSTLLRMEKSISDCLAKPRSVTPPTLSKPKVRSASTLDRVHYYGVEWRNRPVGLDGKPLVFSAPTSTAPKLIPKVPAVSSGEGSVWSRLHADHAEGTKQRERIHSEGENQRRSLEMLPCTFQPFQALDDNSQKATQGPRLSIIFSSSLSSVHERLFSSPIKNTRNNGEAKKNAEHQPFQVSQTWTPLSSSLSSVHERLFSSTLKHTRNNGEAKKNAELNDSQKAKQGSRLSTSLSSSFGSVHERLFSSPIKNTRNNGEAKKNAELNDSQKAKQGSRLSTSLTSSFGSVHERLFASPIKNTRSSVMAVPVVFPKRIPCRERLLNGAVTGEKRGSRVCALVALSRVYTL